MFRPLILPVGSPQRVNVENPVGQAVSLDEFVPIWKQIKATKKHQDFYETNPAAWKESGITYT